ncbi:MAG: thioredoxin family protein [Saprospiraceae bacterium]|nr:thioredoxin family protein [Saprospiraceae bacterium]
MEARIIAITDWQDILAFDIISIPALIIRNQVLSQGFVPTVHDLENLIKAFIPNENRSTKTLNRAINE